MKRGAAMLFSLLAISFALTAQVRGALPILAGGTLRLPSPEPLSGVESMPDGSFEGAVHAAVFETLYALDADDRPVPLLAEALPERDGEFVRIQLRDGIVRHDGRILSARDVVASLRRASRGTFGWLLQGFAHAQSTLDAKVIDPRTLSLRARSPELDVARLLAAAPLAIVAGTRTKPVGTGPFAVTQEGRSLHLRAFPKGVRGAPYLEAIRIDPPVARDEELRAFELGRIDGSWHGETLYGAPPARPTATSQDETGIAMVLLRNPDRDALRDSKRWKAIDLALDRARFARTGMTPERALLKPEEPMRREDGALRLEGVSLRLPVRDGDAFEERLAEVLAALLEELGARVLVERLPRERRDARIHEGSWDMRIEPVLPPLPYAAARIAAALATAGQITDARALAEGPGLFDTELARPYATRFDGVVLGIRRRSLTHRADLAGLRFDRLGRLDFARMHFARRPDGTSP